MGALLPHLDKFSWGPGHPCRPTLFHSPGIRISDCREKVGCCLSRSAEKAEVFEISLRVCHGTEKDLVSEIENGDLVKLSRQGFSSLIKSYHSSAVSNCCQMPQQTDEVK
jgi:hypothetical protein